MTKRSIVVILVVVVLLAGLAVFAGLVGGVSIRALPQQASSISVVSPLVPGVPFTVKYSDAIPGVHGVLLRTQSTEIPLPAEVKEDGIVSEIPCDELSGGAELLIQDTQTQKTVAQISAEILPPGQDCY